MKGLQKLMERYGLSTLTITSIESLGETRRKEFLAEAEKILQKRGFKSSKKYIRQLLKELGLD